MAAISWTPCLLRSRGDAQQLTGLAIPAEYEWLPPTKLGASVLELANLYAAHARDVKTGSTLAPTFADAVRMHELIEQIVESDRTGQRVPLRLRHGEVLRSPSPA